MLGPPKPRRLNTPVAASLDDLVPADHFYRHLEAKLDLGFVREWARELYAERGRPSIDPVVFFKLQLVMFFEGIRSERQLIATASLNLAHRWYLGYALDEPLPDHSSLTRIRHRLGVDTFERFFEKVVDLCQEARLVWGQELFFDATKTRANADLDSLAPRFYYEAKAHVADLFTDELASAEEPGPDSRDSPPKGLLRLPTSEAVADRAGEATEPPWRLLEERRLDPRRPAVGRYRRTADFRVSTTDPDATPMQTRNGAALGYHDHYVVDGGKHRIVLAALVTPADVMENAPMRDLLWRIRFRRKLRPRQVTGDTAYGTIENIVAIEAAGIRAYVPLPDFDSRTPFFGKGEFAYDATRDEYRCPQGQPLRRLKTKFTEQEVVYRADAAACNDCPVKAACTASDRGRSVHRSFFADDLDKVRGYHATEAYRRAMRKRQVWVEPLFAEAKDWHGLRRFRLRGLDNVNIEGLLVAAGQNLKRFLAAAGWGRHHAPCGSLVALPKPPHRPIAVLS
ncbi:MAG: IS1182 family transposase [Chloroflexota bacterium]|nr:IS1182 family transposase [Chloroflexota bacterium]